MTDTPQHAPIEQRHRDLAKEISAWTFEGSLQQLLADLEAAAEQRGADRERARTCVWRWVDENNLEGWRTCEPDLHWASFMCGNPDELDPFCPYCGGRIVQPASEEKR